MANAMYGKGRQKFLEGSIAFGTDTIKAMLVDTAVYVIGANIDVHEFLSDVTAGGQVKASNALATKTTVLGVAGSGVWTFPAVTGAHCEALILYKDTGVASTSPLIAYIDTVASGLPVTPNGGDITVTPDAGANKIFKL